MQRDITFKALNHFDDTKLFNVVCLQDCLQVIFKESSIVLWVKFKRETTMFQTEHMLQQNNKMTFFVSIANRFCLAFKCERISVPIDSIFQFWVLSFGFEEFWYTLYIYHIY